MAIKTVIARGIGFTPGNIKFVVTHGFAIGGAVATTANWNADYNFNDIYNWRADSG